MSVQKVGDWALASAMLNASATRLNASIDQALAREAHLFRNEIIVGMTNQAPGGKAYEELSDTTKAMRYAKYGQRKPKALINRGDFRRAVVVSKMPGGYFVGVMKGKRGKDGQDLVNIAAIHEFGSKTIKIVMTEKMRRYLAMQFKKAGLERKASPGGKSGPRILLIKIPARPTFGPVADKLRPGMSKRVSGSVGKSLGLL